MATAAQTIISRNFAGSRDLRTAVSS